MAFQTWGPHPEEEEEERSCRLKALLSAYFELEPTSPEEEEEKEEEDLSDAEVRKTSFIWAGVSGISHLNEPGDEFGVRKRRAVTPPFPCSCGRARSATTCATSSPSATTRSSPAEPWPGYSMASVRKRGEVGGEEGGGQVPNWPSSPTPLHLLTAAPLLAPRRQPLFPCPDLRPRPTLLEEASLLRLPPPGPPGH